MTPDAEQTIVGWVPPELQRRRQRGRRRWDRARALAAIVPAAAGFGAGMGWLGQAAWHLGRIVAMVHGG